MCRTNGSLGSQRCGDLYFGWRQEIGWGGRIRTFTGLINSEVPYQLDHAPAASAAAIGSTYKVSSAARKGGEGCVYDSTATGIARRRKNQLVWRAREVTSPKQEKGRDRCPMREAE